MKLFRNHFHYYPILLMRYLNIFFALSCFLLSSISLLGQAETVVRGIVMDAETGDPLPFVDVYFLGTVMGGNANIDGVYELKTTEAIDSIGFRFLGYETKQFAITQNVEQELNISLSSRSATLTTATVTAKRRKKMPKDTAAITLWRNVVKNKQTNNMDRIDSYEYDDYTKVQFDLFNLSKFFQNFKFLRKNFSVVYDYVQTNAAGEKFLPSMLKETSKKVYYRKTPKGKKAIVKADKLSGIENETVSEFLGEQLEDINPYDDLIVFVGKSFIGPFAGGANTTYRYFLSDSIERNGDKYYKLDFVGRRQKDFTFLGSAWIHQPTFAIQTIDLEISPYINLNFVKKYKIHQRYDYAVSLDLWMKEYEHMEIMLAIELLDLKKKRKKKRKNTIRVNKYSTHKNIKLNIPLPDTLFDGEPEVWADSARKQSEEYWTEARVDTLSAKEKGIYDMVDSVKRTPTYKALEYIGYVATTAYIPFGPVEFGRFPEFVSWNDIEGVRLKMKVRTTKKFSKRIQLMGYGAYGFKDKEWKYSMSFNLHLPSKYKRWHMLTGFYKYDFVMLGRLNRLYKYDNLIASLTRRDPLDKLMKIREMRLSYTKEWVKGLDNTLSFQQRIFYSVPNVFEFSSEDGNLPVENFKVIEAKLQTHFGYKEGFFTGNGGFMRFTNGSKFPIFWLDYTLGIKGLLGGDYTYHKLDLKAQHRLNWQAGFTWYEIGASKTFGGAPYPLLKMHLGNESIMHNKYAYGLMNEFEFVSDEHVSFWMEHHFDGWIMNTIPFINKLDLRLLTVFKGLMGRLSKESRNILDIPLGMQAPKFYAEVGFGVENILKLFRIDFMWRLTQLELPTTQKFGVIIAIQPKF
ncbi:MAG: carboxypeptidase-like regulatory domain-containing protein [Aureispira sp.]|nr:carboxypeptidase-like regulatory domain-containing protein [Aureispira sp.]